jgi:hypothetical protein
MYLEKIKKANDIKKIEKEHLGDLAQEIREFLIGHRAEVKDLCITKYNEAETMQMIREEGREEGDLKRARKTAANMLKDGDSIDKVARVLELSLDIIRAWMEKL